MPKTTPEHEHVARLLAELEPRMYFRDKLQSADFVGGALAVRDLIAKIHGRGPGPCNTENASAAFFADDVATLLDSTGDRRRGVIAALASWFVVTAWSEVEAVDWVPLELHTRHSCLDGKRDHDDPAPHSKFFDVGGTPVSVSPGLTCYAYNDHDAYLVDLKTVQQRGVPISRRRFDQLRASKAGLRDGAAVAPNG